MKNKFIILASVILTISLIFSRSAFAEAQVGKEAPDFTATDINGKEVKLSDLSSQGKIVVLEWFNYGCPFVKKHYEKSGNIPNLQKKYTGDKVVWLAINSTNTEHPDYLTAEEMQKEQAKKKFAGSNIILDVNGKIGKSYGAETTPHFFIVKDGNVVYKGGIDSIRSANPKDIKKAEDYISMALDELLAGKEISKPVTKHYGCSVKYAR